MKLDPLDLESYNYSLPKELIATYPTLPAHNSKLLVYEREKEKVTHTIFKELPNYLPPEATLIFNDTKVIKARIFGKKESGGKIELLLNRPLKENLFSVFIKGKVKKGTTLIFPSNLVAKVIALKGDGSREVKFFLNQKELNFFELLDLLDKIGTIPLPPYLNREAKKEDEVNYQPIFAKKEGAVAAPTASLHFTQELLDNLSNPKQFLTLHVGAGTFKPVESKKITYHKIHTEYYEIPKSTQETILSSKPIVAVGTTVTRAIEYFFKTHQPKGECDLFLHPLNPPQRVNHLITNFHLPKSTLLMLVASFIGVEKTLQLYQEAIKNSYRFYSYGDAMLII
ncbi:MAG: tRNA preQ1(34) S-adenosylmethionine ribosyltransferase-isomerase QueA [Epsilonproteobacteria bacterium]|nr:tRNA preQ1(34) S-adenosylmethionine ribosyltransferase-isomerase QueA [Campylobacterota bacterium]